MAVLPGLLPSLIDVRQAQRRPKSSRAKVAEQTDAEAGHPDRTESHANPLEKKGSSTIPGKNTGVKRKKTKKASKGPSKADAKLDPTTGVKRKKTKKASKDLSKADVKLDPTTASTRVAGSAICIPQKPSFPPSDASGSKGSKPSKEKSSLSGRLSGSERGFPMSARELEAGDFRPREGAEGSGPEMPSRSLISGSKRRTPEEPACPERNVPGLKEGKPRVSTSPPIAAAGSKRSKPTKPEDTEPLPLRKTAGAQAEKEFLDVAVVESDLGTEGCGGVGVVGQGDRKAGVDRAILTPEALLEVARLEATHGSDSRLDVLESREEELARVIQPTLAPTEPSKVEPDKAGVGTRGQDANTGVGARSEGATTSVETDQASGDRGGEGVGGVEGTEASQIQPAKADNRRGGKVRAGGGNAVMGGGVDVVVPEMTLDILLGKEVRNSPLPRSRSCNRRQLSLTISFES
jgi:hypothetical protein